MGTGGIRTEEPLEVVDNDDAQRALVAVLEDLGNRGDLLCLGEADHAVGRDELHEGVLRRLRDGRCERGLAGAWRAV